MIWAVVALAAGASFQEDFSRGMENWWVEGGERVWVENGRLHVKADDPKTPGGGVATVWCKVPHAADYEFEAEAHVISSSIDANNINLFLNYRDPSGKPLFESRASRSSAAYKLYHDLEGYIITFLNDAQAEGGRNANGSTKARIRIRRCPGFQLLAEKFGGTCRQGVTYRLRVRKEGGEITFFVNDEEALRARDPQPLGPGLIGLRTFRTYLWWDNIRVTPLTKK